MGAENAAKVPVIPGDMTLACADEGAPRPQGRSVHARAPSVAQTISPPRSVRRTVVPATRRVSSVSGRGWPKRLRTPDEIAATSGRTAARNSGDVEVLLPW